MFCGKCEKKEDGMHQLFCDPKHRFTSPYICKECLDEANRAEMFKCKSDPVHFYENYCTVNGEKVPPLTDYQKQMIREMRKMGGSVRHFYPKNLGK